MRLAYNIILRSSRLAQRQVLVALSVPRDKDTKSECMRVLALIFALFSCFIVPITLFTRLHVTKIPDDVAQQS